MRKGSHCQAFSLLEILVAVAVLALIGLILAQIIGAVGQTTRVANRGINAAAQARLAFDRIGVDLACLIKRADTDFLAASGADNLLFVSLVSAASAPGLPAADNRGLSIIAYRVGANTADGNRPCLLRGARAITWADTGFFGLDVDGLPVCDFHCVSTATSDFDALAPGVLRLVIGYQLYPDNQPVTLADGSVISHTLGQVVFSPPLRSDVGSLHRVDLARISALVVGVVALDLDTAKCWSQLRSRPWQVHFLIPPRPTACRPHLGAAGGEPRWSSRERASTGPAGRACLPALLPVTPFPPASTYETWRAIQREGVCAGGDALRSGAGDGRSAGFLLAVASQPQIAFSSTNLAKTDLLAGLRSILLSGRFGAR